MNLHNWRVSGRVVLPMGPMSDPVAAKLFSFQGLPNGWHYGSGKAPSTFVVIIALSLITQLRKLGAEKFEVFPEVMGEILVSAYHDDICLDITIHQNGQVSYVAERGDEEIEADDDPVHILELISKVGAKKWLPGNLSDLSIQSTTARRSHASSHPPLKIQTEPVFQWSMNAA